MLFLCAASEVLYFETGLKQTRNDSKDEKQIENQQRSEQENWFGMSQARGISSKMLVQEQFSFLMFKKMLY